ncbi:MAG: hypothetical protein ABDI19_06940 [Armatimonadota bacterium]
MRHLILLIGVLGLIVASAPQQRVQPRLDRRSLNEAYPALVDAILNAVREGGGDVRTQYIHWVFGFSTGHFAADPTAAEAARYLASKIVADHAKVGDQVSSYAWEMELWDHLPKQPRTVTIQSKTPEYAQQVYNLWPQTPRKDTVGGHDTERAIVEIVQEIGDAQDAIIILFVPTAASIAAPGTKVLGQNHPEYQKVLMRWKRFIDTGLSGASRGASMQVRYRVIKPFGETVHRTLDVVLLVPHRFAGRPVAFVADSQPAKLPEQRRGQDGKPDAPRDEKPNTLLPRTGAVVGTILRVILVISIAALAIALVIASIFLIMKWILPSPLSVTINSEHLHVLRSGNERIILTGSNAEYTPEGWHKVVLNGAPPKEFARIRRQGAGIVVSAENSNMQVDDMVRNEYFLKAGDYAQLEFYGTEPAEIGLPPQDWKVSVNIKVDRVRE